MMAERPHVSRGYTTCRFGQMHFLRGAPSSSAHRTAPPLVMLHQTPSSSEEYAPVLRLLARDRLVLAFDTPGYGMSDPPPGPQSVARYAEAFCDAIDALALGERIDLFGYHTGTLMAAEVALARRDAVGRLVLSGVPMRSPAEREARLAAARASPRPSEDGAALLAQSAALWRYVVTQRDKGVELERAVVMYAEKNKPLHRFWWAYEGVWSYPYAERLPLLTHAILFLQPHDALLETTRQACALVQNGVFQELPELERDIFDIAPDRLAACIAAFLT